MLRLAQQAYKNQRGQICIENDWFDKPLPVNIFLDEMSYPDTSYSFTTFYSEKPIGFKLGFASGNYGHGVLTTGTIGEISVGKFVVLQCTHIIANQSVIINDHCMFSWGSVITDSWIDHQSMNPGIRRHMLEKTAVSANRHVEFNARPVVVEENVWVGFDAIVMPGVTIGRGAVIGCKTLVTMDVPAYAVVIGNPSRIIKYLDPDDTPEVKEHALIQFLGK